MGHFPSPRRQPFSFYNSSKEEHGEIRFNAIQFLTLWVYGSWNLHVYATLKVVIQMVIPPPVRPPRVTQFLKPYVLKMHFTNQYVNAQVTHSPTATVASAASSQEKALRSTMENTRDVAAAAKIGKILGERLLLKDIPAVTVFLNRNQKYHGKVKAVIDSLREVGIKII
ncbi:hypothetical protein POTOM_027423 [Populus tomentosa]|uniref:Ribosomal L18p/L5e family protein n=2 Tax=Populus TaxID=3689 RepID=A0A8X8CW52_POPTO|nr:hypothetical protein POTOM_027423 [Populus tomentosa]